MIVRSIDIDNDFTFGQGKNNYKRDRFAVAQNIKTRLQSFLGDCFFSPSHGVDWFTLLGGKNFTALKLAIITTVLNTRYVTSLVEIDFIPNPDDRSVYIKYTVDTEYGQITDNILRNGSIL